MKLSGDNWCFSWQGHDLRPVQTLNMSNQSLLTKENSTGIPEFLDSGRKSWTLDTGRWTLDSGRWTLDSGCWTLDSGRWTLDVGLWMLDSGRWTLDAGHWILNPRH